MCVGCVDLECKPSTRISFGSTPPLCKPKSVLREKIEKNMVCFVLTFTVFHIVLSANSAVLLYSLGSNLLFLVSSGKSCHARPSASV